MLLGTGRTVKCVLVFVAWHALLACLFASLPVNVLLSPV